MAPDPNPKRVAIYSRCSTNDQEPEIQLQALRTYSNLRGWNHITEYSDVGFTGSTGDRPDLKRLLKAIRCREIDVVCVVKLDRLFRSLQHLVSTLNEFQQLNVEFVSLSDQIDLTTASGKLHLQIIGAFAEFEKSLIQERTRAGLQYARSLGKTLGRPRSPYGNEIIRLRDQGKSYRQIESDLGVSSTVISRVLKAQRNGLKNEP